MFSFKSIFIVRTIPRATFNDLTYTTICFSCYSLHFFHIHNNNCSLDLYNRDLQITIILFTRNVSSHKINWILYELPLLALSCLLYHRLSSRMSLSWQNLCKCKQVACSIVVGYLFAYPLFLYCILLLSVYS